MPTVLVASDSKSVRESVQTSLVRPGFTVVQAERGQDVTPYVASSPPDLVILDLQIGNMGGVATALDLRLEHSAGRCPAVPILLLLDREADRFLANRAQVDAVLVKPFDPGTLRRRVKTLLEQAEETSPPEEGAPEPAGGSAPVADGEEGEDDEAGGGESATGESPSEGEEHVPDEESA